MGNTKRKRENLRLSKLSEADITCLKTFYARTQAPEDARHLSRVFSALNRPQDTIEWLIKVYDHNPSYNVALHILQHHEDAKLYEGALDWLDRMETDLKNGVYGPLKQNRKAKKIDEDFKRIRQQMYKEQLSYEHATDI